MTTITSGDVEQLTALLDRGRDEWIHGRLQWEAEDASIAQAPDATILGPFGGIAPPGNAPKVRPDIQRQIAGQFKGGSGSTELIRAITVGDLAVVVYVDRSMVRFDGYDDPQPWTLRVTEVFRKEPDAWVRVHRHADPLARFRDLPSTLALLTSQ